MHLMSSYRIHTPWINSMMWAIQWIMNYLHDYIELLYFSQNYENIKTKFINYIFG